MDRRQRRKPYGRRPSPEMVATARRKQADGHKLTAREATALRQAQVWEAWDAMKAETQERAQLREDGISYCGIEVERGVFAHWGCSHTEALTA